MKFLISNPRLNMTIAIIFVVSALSILFWTRTQSTSVLADPSTITLTPGKYDPAYYGLPDEIGGYPVLAVEASDIQPCATPGILTLILQVPQGNVRDFLRDDATQKGLREAMRAYDPSGTMQFSAVGPGMTHEQLQANYATLESKLQGMGCVRSVLPERALP